MANSMTAFARTESNQISWEIRSVNQRYLDVSFRMPDAFRSIEIPLKAVLRKYLIRGKVECTLRVNSELSQISLVIDKELVTALLGAAEEISSLTKNNKAPESLDVLRWPGVLLNSAANTEQEKIEISDTFRNAVTSLQEMRLREGTELKKLILGQLAEVAKIVTQVRQEAPVILEQQHQRLLLRLEKRLEQLQAEIDGPRLEQELVYLAQKSDVVEELDRLEIHIEEVRHTLDQKGAIGRRLDFLMQELNREANTLSSKASVSATSMQAVDLKVIIEQMREQVQNIE
ncbi:MAG: YicC/YloC family endoribonuclease [Pseudomonadales bacterium]